MPITRAGAIDVVAGAEPAPTSQSAAHPLVELREAALRAAGVLPQPPLPAGEQPRFWLRRGDQLVVATLVALATALMLGHWIRLSDWGRRTVEVERLPAADYVYRIDINQATWVEWAQFDGVGETLARRIVADREVNGPFRSIEDVQRVPGIGPIRWQAMRPHLELR